MGRRSELPYGSEKFWKIDSRLCSIMGIMGFGWAPPWRGNPPPMVVLLKVNRPSGDRYVRCEYLGDLESMKLYVWEGEAPSCAQGLWSAHGFIGGEGGSSCSDCGLSGGIST